MNIAWLNLSDTKRRRLLERAAIKNRISAKAIEKDWWITLTLRALFCTAYAPFCVLKGGVSLSKAWNLLPRFSFDIDIALMPEAFNMRYRSNPPFSFVKLLERNGCFFVRTLLRKELIAAFERLGVRSADIAVELRSGRIRDPQSLFIRYRSVLVSGLSQLEQIQIEFSVRGLRDPFAYVSLQSLLSATCPGDGCNETPFWIQAVPPHKTLIEKMFLLHEKFSGKRSFSGQVHRQSRHLYDVVQLINTRAAPDALADTGLYARLIEHRRNYTRLRNVDYDSLKHEALCLVPSAEWINALRKDYESIKDTMIYGKAVSFDQLLRQLKLFNRKVRTTDLSSSGYERD